MTNIIWQPDKKRIADANILKFCDIFAYEKHNFEQLWRESITRPEKFWSDCFNFCNIVTESHPSETVDDIKRLPGAKWFQGTKLNYCKNLLRGPSTQTAIISYMEDKRAERLTFGELTAKVSQVAAALKEIGIGVGDRVAAFMPNVADTVIAALATSAIGAIWSSCSPDFGVDGVVDRFGQISPKAIFLADGYFFKGQAISLLEKNNSLLSRLESNPIVISANYISNVDTISSHGSKNREISLQTIYDTKPEPINYSSLNFDHPLAILYSSGTTGLPKCIVHGQGGTLLEHMKEHQLHNDIKPGDTVFYYTTCGWMMWNWLISALASDATIVLYDGSPFHPTPTALFDIVQHESVNIFGTSARYIAALQKEEVNFQPTHNLTSLKSILSTGSPLLPENFDYVYSNIKSDLCLASISGGTDIVGCFFQQNPIGPVYRGTLQARSLGLDVQVFDDTGSPVIGQRGELVCCNAAPSMPIYFWNDTPDQEKYRSAYFEKFDGVWCHGDYAEINPDGSAVIYGRADATLKPGGVRIGTAEIYRVVDELPAINESIVVAQEWQGDVRIVLFVKLSPGHTLTPELITEIKSELRAKASPRHVPAKIISITEVPRTMNGKLVELAVANVIHGRPIKNRASLINPDSLKQFENMPELAK